MPTNFIILLLIVLSRFSDINVTRVIQDDETIFIVNGNHSKHDANYKSQEIFIKRTISSSSYDDLAARNPSTDLFPINSAHIYLSPSATRYFAA